MIDLRVLPIYMQVAALLIGVVLLLAIVGRMKIALWALAAMLFASCIGVATTWTGAEIRLWLYPVQVNRSAFFLGLGVVLLLGAIGHSGSMSVRGLRGQGLILLFMGLYAGLLRMVHETTGSGLQTIAFVLLTVVPILLMSQALLDQEDDFLPFMRAIMLVNIVWIAGVAVQLMVNPGIMTGGKGARFVGLSPNPQNAGLTLATLGVFVLWLILNDPKRHLRPLWIAVFSADVMLILVTGSRTSAGAFVLGAMIATYGRLGRVILLLPLLLVVLYLTGRLAAAVFLDFGEAAARLGSLQDTRTGTWQRMLQDGLEHPWIGVGVVETESENSYLKALASYGAGMVALIMVLIAVSARLMWRLYWLRRWVDPTRRAMIDLIIAFNGMYFAASLFEGILIGRVALLLTLMLIFSVIGTDLLRRESERLTLEAERYGAEDMPAHPYGDGAVPEYQEADHPA